MGIHDREYVRSDSSRPYAGGMGDGTSFIVGLIIVNVVIFFAQLVWTAEPLSQAEMREIVNNDQNLRELPAADRVAIAVESFRNQRRESVLNRWLVLDTEKVVFQGQVWRVFTYMFLHNDAPGGHWHIVANMWLLFLVGPRLVEAYGRREFLLFYLIGGVAAGMATLGFDLLMRDYRGCLGASGAVCAALVLYACNWPRQQWLFFFVIPVPVYVLVIIAALLDLVPILQQIGGNPVYDNLGHAAHLGGMAFAYVYHRSLWRIEPLYLAITRLSWKRSDLRTSLRARSRGLRVIRPEQDPVDLETRVDELLQKILEQGEASLTADERAILVEASRRKRARSGDS
jgi:membrane associated rhomboid family serine protease